MNWLKIPNLKGKDRYETWENYSIVFIFFGVILLILGIGTTVITTKGIPAILSMLGAFISFIATVALIVIWLVRDMKGV